MGQTEIRTPLCRISAYGIRCRHVPTLRRQRPGRQNAHQTAFPSRKLTVAHSLSERAEIEETALAHGLGVYSCLGRPRGGNPEETQPSTDRDDSESIVQESAPRVLVRVIRGTVCRWPANLPAPNAISVISVRQRRTFARDVGFSHSLSSDQVSCRPNTW